MCFTEGKGEFRVGRKILAEARGQVRHGGDVEVSLRIQSVVKLRAAIGRLAQRRAVRPQLFLVFAQQFHRYHSLIIEARLERPGGEGASVSLQATQRVFHPARSQARISTPAKHKRRSVHRLYVEILRREKRSSGRHRFPGMDSTEWPRISMQIRSLQFARTDPTRLSPRTASCVRIAYGL